MANKTIAFDGADLGVTTSSVVVSRINLKPDNSGDWNMGVDFAVESPSRNTSKDASISIIERHMLNATITVKRSEIATAAGVTEEEVRTSLTLNQVETLVTTVALAKLFPAVGIDAQNVVIT